MADAGSHAVAMGATCFTVCGPFLVLAAERLYIQQQEDKRVIQHTEADAILANALLEDASAHDAGDFHRIAASYDDVLGQLLPIQNVDERRFSIALRFWDMWGGACTSRWREYPEIEKSAWPKMARHIALKLKQGEAATDSTVIAHFAPENISSWRKSLRSWLRKLWR